MSMGEQIRPLSQPSAPSVAQGSGMTTGVVVVNPDGSTSYQGPQQPTSAMTGVLPAQLQIDHTPPMPLSSQIMCIVIGLASIHWILMVAVHGDWGVTGQKHKGFHMLLLAVVISMLIGGVASYFN